MALDKNEKKAEKNGSTTHAAMPSSIDAAIREAALRGSAGDDWVQTGIAYLYKPEHFVKTKSDGGIEACWEMKDGKKVPTAPVVRGIPYGTRFMEGKGNDEGYYQLLVELTADTFVLVGEGADKHEVVVEKGLTMMFNMTKSLERLVTLSEHPTEATEVEIRPIQKEPIGNNKTMWKYSVRENPSKIKKVYTGAAAQLEAPANPLS